MLFSSVDEIKDYRPITNNFDWSDIQPFVAEAEESEIIPFISRDEYDTLNEKIQDGSIGSDADYKELLNKIRRPLANISFFFYIPYGNVNMQRGGIGVVEDTGNKIASQWRISDLKQSCLEGYCSGIEQTLLYMESKKDVFTDWAGSSSFTEFKECFVNTSVDFSSFLGTTVSRRIFLMIKGIMKRVEDDNIVSVTGQDLFDEIKTQIKAGTVSADNAKLLKFIQPAVTNLTMVKAISFLPIRVTEKGIQIYHSSNTLTVDDDEAAERERLIKLETTCLQEGEKEKKKLADFLFKNHGDYPLYEDDDTVYNPDNTTNINDCKSGSFFL